MYKQCKDFEGNVRTDMIRRVQDGAWITTSLDNTDYQAYLAWIEQGNVPEPAEI
jgi:hypothetical protein